MEKCSAKYPIDLVSCKTYSKSIGSKSFMQENVFLGAMPKRIIIGFLENIAYTEQLDLNPFYFHHHNTTSHF